jgi:hypothetical protein
MEVSRLYPKFAKRGVLLLLTIRILAQLLSLSISHYSINESSPSRSAHMPRLYALGVVVTTCSIIRDWSFYCVHTSVHVFPSLVCSSSLFYCLLVTYHTYSSFHPMIDIGIILDLLMIIDKLCSTPTYSISHIVPFANIC